MTPLWQLMDARNKRSSQSWKDWLSGIGEMPIVDQKAMHVSTMEAPESLPNLVEALETLDEELGFLD